MNNLEFITGGKAIFTLVSKETGAYYTYKVIRSNTTYFVNLLIAPEEYKYIGYFFHKNLELNPPKFDYNLRNTTSFKAMAYTLRHIHNLTKVIVKHEGRCGRCGRRLTTPESIDSGFGKYCLSKKT